MGTCSGASLLLECPLCDAILTDRAISATGAAGHVQIAETGSLQGGQWPLWGIAIGREHELAKVGFRVAEVQWPLFGFEFEFFKAHSRPLLPLNRN